MIDTLLRLLFPERCTLCNTPGIALCKACYATIPVAHNIYSMDTSYAMYDYGHPTVQKAIWELKYYRKSPLAKALISHAAPFLQKYVSFLPANPIVLVPVPQHYTKTWSRGFNQSTLIASWIQAVLPRTSVQRLLKKVQATDAQAKKNKKAREQNLSGTIVSSPIANPDALYFLVDDVITTGSTIRETSRALRAAGAKHVYAIAIAHGYRT